MIVKMNCYERHISLLVVSMYFSRIDEYEFYVISNLQVTNLVMQT